MACGRRRAGTSVVATSTPSAGFTSHWHATPTAMFCSGGACQRPWKTHNPAVYEVPQPGPACSTETGEQRLTCG